MRRNILLTIIMLILSTICFWLSFHYSNKEKLVKDAYEDCSLLSTIPSDILIRRCADPHDLRIAGYTEPDVDKILVDLDFKAHVFKLAGIVFFLALVCVPFIIFSRELKTERTGTLKLKI